MAKTSHPADLPQLEAHPALAEVASRLFYWSSVESSAAAYLRNSLPVVVQILGGEYAAVVRGEKGKWRTLGKAGADRSLPTELLADALDRNAPCSSKEWYAAPLAPQSESGEVLATHRIWDHASEAGGAAEAVALWLHLGLSAVRKREQQQQREQRLQAILEIAAQWQQTLEMAPLLVRMAETSTRLLNAERASIFLWDKPNKTLVGRPALGVPGGELRIPDNTGIVGQVVQSGEPRRVDADIAVEQSEVDRRVDKQVNFQTRSLVCVPLRGRSGELFGAFEVLNKIGGNFTDDDTDALIELATHASAALENTQQIESLLAARKNLADLSAEGVKLIGHCPPIEALRSAARRVADTELSVLILGENGTGKEVVSQMIHYQSRRRNEPFVAVNCAALTETLLESELFGHEKGAFTDAREMRQGKFELASGGTLFLDEIGDMSLGGQAKLLRVLEEKVVVRVGGSVSISTDARVLAATNQNLAELVRSKRFREDLFFRLNVVTLEIPPLEARRRYRYPGRAFPEKLLRRARRKMPKFTAAAKKRMLAHNWPGNVRELRNLMERLAYLLPEEQDKIDASDLAFILSPTADAAGVFALDVPLTDATRSFQIELIRKHIEASRGNMTSAAERLGLHRSNLYRKMRQLGMDDISPEAEAD